MKRKKSEERKKTSLQNAFCKYHGKKKKKKKGIENKNPSQYMK
jgi:hypothetical protein